MQLARDGWLRTEPGEGFEPVQDHETPEPQPAASAVVAPPTDRAAALLWAADRLAALRSCDDCDPGRHDAIEYLRAWAVEAHDTGTQQPPVPQRAYPDCERCGDTSVDPEWDGAEPCPECQQTHEPAPVAQQQPNIGARAEEPPTEEQMVRDHVTTLHLIGEQLTRVESWMWAHLADVRDAQAATPAPVAQQPAALRGELKPWQLLADQPDEPLPQTERVIGGRRLATSEQQPAAADGEEARTTWTPGPVAVAKAAEWARQQQPSPVEAPGADTA